MPIRVLLLADTHLGFDLPTSPRVVRRRRGHDFQAGLEAALAPALAGEVDLVVHGGDVFHRPGVPPSLVFQAFEPLRRVADLGVPVFVVPGNHERSRIPHVRHARHPLISIFDVPRTFRVRVRDTVLALAGFPYVRKVRERFAPVLAATGWAEGSPEDVRVLCAHHCFEGVQVEGFTFRDGPDVVRSSDIPSGLTAVLTGHVHRRQVLTRDLRGRVLPAPVLYPGSVERTSFAERDEPKGYLVVEVSGAGESTEVEWSQHDLPARPMVVRELDGEGVGGERLRAGIRDLIEAVPQDAVLRVRIRGRIRGEARRVLAASRLRALTPESMNLDVSFADERMPRREWKRKPTGDPQPDLPLLLM